MEATPNSADTVATTASERLRETANFLWPWLLVVTVWETVAYADWSNTDLIPPPSVLVLTTFSLLRSGILLQNTLGSVSRVVAGFSLAIVIGMSMGVLLGTYPIIARRLTPLLDVLRPIPPIAWIPIAILWFGLGNASAVFIVALGAFFPVFVSTFGGIRSVSQHHVNAARCLGASSRLVMTDVLFPAALPQVLTGLRVGMGIAWTSVIAAEMVGARTGLGYAIQLNRTMLATESVIVNMVAIGVIGWIMNRLISALEQRLTRWNRGTFAEWQVGTQGRDGIAPYS